MTKYPTWTSSYGRGGRRCILVASPSDSPATHSATNILAHVCFQNHLSVDVQRYRRAPQGRSCIVCRRTPSLAHVARRVEATFKLQTFSTASRTKRDYQSSSTVSMSNSSLTHSPCTLTLLPGLVRTSPMPRTHCTASWTTQPP